MTVQPHVKLPDEPECRRLHRLICAGDTTALADLAEAVGETHLPFVQRLARLARLADDLVGHGEQESAARLRRDVEGYAVEIVSSWHRGSDPWSLGLYGQLGDLLRFMEEALAEAEGAGDDAVARTHRAAIREVHGFRRALVLRASSRASLRPSIRPTRRSRGPCTGRPVGVEPVEWSSRHRRAAVGAGVA